MYAKFCVSREAASHFMRLFVNRRAYGIQAERPLPNGSVPYYPARNWKTREPKTLDDGVARMHLNGDITISLYAINPETQRSKWVAIDADFDGALESLFQLQWELKQDGVDAALEQSRRGGHLWIFGAEPLLASECRIYVYNLALRLGVPVKGGGLKEGIEVFPRQDRIKDGELGNAIRAPLGVHRKTNRRYWFYEAEPTPEAQLAYLDRLTKLTEAELRTFIEGMSLPEAYRPVVPASYTPPTSSPSYPEFRILDYVRTTRKDGRNWWARCPSCAGAGRDRSGDNLAIQIQDPRFYKCWAGCTKEEIRAALGQSIRKLRHRSGSKRMNASKKQKPEFRNLSSRQSMDWHCRRACSRRSRSEASTAPPESRSNTSTSPGAMYSGAWSQAARSPIWAGRALSSRRTDRRLRGYSPSTRLPSMAVMPFFLQKAWCVWRCCAACRPTSWRLRSTRCHACRGANAPELRRSCCFADGTVSSHSIFGRGNTAHSGES